MKSDYIHPVIIKHRAECRMCRWDSKASTVTSYTRVSDGYDVTVLALLSRRHVQHLCPQSKNAVSTVDTAFYFGADLDKVILTPRINIEGFCAGNRPEMIPLLLR